MNKITYDELREWMLKSIDWKIERSILRIKQYYETLNGNVYVSFSGGKDSTVLLDLVRRLYQDVKAVFVNTGLEYPEIVSFVKSISNVNIIYPKISFNEVIDKYGYPVVSKDVSMSISRYRNTKNNKIKHFRLYGIRNGISGYNLGVIPNKWKYLINAPFKISDMCCDIIKKHPFNRYEKVTNTYPLIGTLASESNRREREFLRNGCNVFGIHNKSMPLSFWSEKDIWDYIKLNNLKYSKIYDMGEKRTGCMYCMFGCDKESYPNRFRRMKLTHPILWKYCIYKLGLGDVLRYMGIDSGIDLLDSYLERSLSK